MSPIISALPAVNAALNGISAILIALGFFEIKRRNRQSHERYMLAASIVTAIFFISYITKTVILGTTVFGGTGFIRGLYFTILFSHLTLAIVIIPFIVVTLVTGLKKRFRTHRRFGRWVVPVWLYVSVTGVCIFFMLQPYY